MCFSERQLEEQGRGEGLVQWDVGDGGMRGRGDRGPFRRQKSRPGSDWNEMVRERMALNQTLETQKHQWHVDLYQLRTSRHHHYC